MSAFHVDARIDIKLHFDLAVRLGEIILNSRPNDGQLRALGHNLVNLDEDTAKRYLSESSDYEKWDEKWNNEEPKPAPEWRKPVSSNEIAKVPAAMREKVASRKIRWGVR